jgi:hypothetical protein
VEGNIKYGKLETTIDQDLTPCSQLVSETPVCFYQSTRRHNSAACNLHTFEIPNLTVLNWMAYT